MPAVFVAGATNLRFYGSAASKKVRIACAVCVPTPPNSPKELIAAGVDLLNTDQLEAAQNFLLENDPRHAELQ